MASKALAAKVVVNAAEKKANDAQAKEAASGAAAGAKRCRQHVKLLEQEIGYIISGYSCAGALSSSSSSLV